MQEVFKVESGEYARKNAFWKYQNLTAMSSDCDDKDRDMRALQIARSRAAYDKLSKTYQAPKTENGTLPNCSVTDLKASKRLFTDFVLLAGLSVRLRAAFIQVIS